MPYKGGDLDQLEQRALSQTSVVTDMVWADNTGTHEDERHIILCGLTVTDHGLACRCRGMMLSLHILFFGVKSEFCFSIASVVSPFACRFVRNCIGSAVFVIRMAQIAGI